MSLRFYKSGGDTGSVLADSVQPCLDGERGNALILNRPLQNLRNRSEVVRESFDVKELLMRSDRGFCFAGEPDTKIVVQASGSGYAFRLNSTGSWNDYDRDLILIPIISAATWSSSLPVMAKYVYDDDSGGKFSIYPLVSGSIRKVAAGAHQILFRTFKVTGENLPSGPVVTIEGSATPTNPDPTTGPVTVAVQIADNGSSTIQQIVDAINAHVGASKIVTVGEVTSGSRSFSSVLGPIRFYEGASPLCVGGIDDEAFKITGTQLCTFFSTNVIPEGGFLVLDFYQPSQRLGYSLLEDASLVLRAVAPGEDPGDTRNIAESVGVIPICKVLAGKLYFSHGRVFQATYSDAKTYDLFLDSLAENNRLRNELAVASGSPYGDFMIGAAAKSSTNLPLTAGTINSQLTKLTDLGVADSIKGSALIGSNAISGGEYSLSAGKLRNQISSLLTQITSNSGTGHGAGRIGVEAYGSPTRLERGYISNQIHECWDDLISHIQSSSSHSLNKLERPFVVVSRDFFSGDGDYYSIATAINSLKPTGGLILVKPGTYTSDYVDDWGANGSFDYPIDVIGLGDVYWDNTTYHCHYYMRGSCYLRNRISFTNITFRCVNGYGFRTAIPVDSSSIYGRLIFQDCRFSMADGNSRVLYTEPTTSNHTFIFRGCSVKYDTSSYSWVGAIECGSTFAGHIQLIGNKFNNCGCIVRASYTASGVGSLTVVGNEFYKCGYSGGAYPVLFSIYGASSVRISKNSYPACTHDTGNYAALGSFVGCDVVFCDSNYLNNTLNDNVFGASGDSQKSWVTGNISSSTTLGGVFASMYGNFANVSRNVFAPDIAFYDSIRLGNNLPSAIVHGNDLQNTSIDTRQTSGSGYSIISNNRSEVSGIAGGSWSSLYGGAGTPSAFFIIRRNKMIGLVDPGPAITCDIYSRSILCDNQLRKARALSSGSFSIVCGNQVDTKSGLSFVYGISVSPASSQVNSIYGNNVVVLYTDQTNNRGIQCWNYTPHYLIIRKNRIINAGQAYHSGGGVGSGDNIFDGNVFEQSGISVYSPDSYGVVLTRNIINTASGPSSNGFKLDGSSKDTVCAGNLFLATSAGHVFMEASSVGASLSQFLVFIDNILHQNSQGVGMFIGGSPTVHNAHMCIAGNIFYKDTAESTAYPIWNVSSADHGQIAFWENVCRKTGYYTGFVVLDAYAKGFGLGADNTAQNHNLYNIYES
jgi:hypothetical protein